MKTITLYRIFTILLALMLFMDGIGGIGRFEAGQEVMRHLGYPVYLLSIAGTAKLLAVVAILQNKYMALKEWAFAGVTITFIGAFASRAYTGDAVFETIFPLIMLTFVLTPYFLWKKTQLSVN